MALILLSDKNSSEIFQKPDGESSNIGWYLMSMLNISFNKQMYQPTEINVVIHLFTYQTEDYAEEYYPLSTAMVDS